MRRLYLQIYLTIIAILVIVVVTVGGLWRVGFDESRFDEMLAVAGDLAANALPAPDAPRERQQEALDQLHGWLRVDLALYGSQGALLASAGRPLPVLRSDGISVRLEGRGAWLLPLRDGRFLVTGSLRGPWRRGPWLLAALIAIAAAVAVGAFPIARRLTRRLERLKAGVEQLGEGDLAARVRVEGKDEVAALAASFNRSAGRVEELVNSHKLLLANCSHELRTPLTRINMALALLGANIDPQQREHLKADIAELDQLIDEILLASRLDAVRAPERGEEVDLLALAAEETARDGIAVDGEPVFVHGEPTLLRRLVRNLIENARRHAGDTAPQVHVARTTNGQALLTVRDHGPGVPAGERDRIFQPFYRPSGFVESGKGSGLGLALVRQIARHHGGEAECRPADGAGSVFAVTLPAGTAGSLA